MKDKQLITILFITVILLALIVALGLIFWSKTKNTTTLDTSYNPNICWSYVHSDEGKMFWWNGCKGEKGEGLACTEAIIELTPDEAAEYNKWINAEMPSIEGCMF